MTRTTTQQVDCARSAGIRCRGRVLLGVIGKDRGQRGEVALSQVPELEVRRGEADVEHRPAREVHLGTLVGHVPAGRSGGSRTSGTLLEASDPVAPQRRALLATDLLMPRRLCPTGCNHGAALTGLPLTAAMSAPSRCRWQRSRRSRDLREITDPSWHS